MEPKVSEPWRPKMVDVALSSSDESSAAALSRARFLGRLRFGDVLFYQLTRAAAILVLVILSGVIIGLINGSLPALQALGFNFLIERRWSPFPGNSRSLA